MKDSEESREKAANLQLICRVLSLLAEVCYFCPDRLIQSAACASFSGVKTEMTNNKTVVEDN